MGKDTITFKFSREALHTDGARIVGNAFYDLAATLFEWGGERNLDGNGKPACDVHGHHTAQRISEYAVAAWMGWGNPLAADLTRANDRLLDALIQLDAHRQAWALVRRAVDLGVDGMILTPEAQGIMGHVLASYTPSDAESVIDRLADLEDENKRLTEALRVAEAEKARMAAELTKKSIEVQALSDELDARDDEDSLALLGDDGGPMV